MKKVCCYVFVVLFLNVNNNSYSSTDDLNRYEYKIGYDVISAVGDTTQPSSMTLGFNFTRQLYGKFGASFGIDYLNRRFEVTHIPSAQSYYLSSHYVDAVLAASYTASSQLKWVKSVTTFLGGFTSIPLDDLRDDGTGFSVKTNTSSGIYLASSARIYNSSSFDFGFHTWVKQGLTQAFDNNHNNKLFSFGLGFSIVH